MSKPVPRYIDDREEMDVGQIARHMKGEQIENPKWREARDAALLAAGLEPEGDDDNLDPADMTVDQHFNRLRKRNA